MSVGKSAPRGRAAHKTINPAHGTIGYQRDAPILGTKNGGIALARCLLGAKLLGGASGSGRVLLSRITSGFQNRGHFEYAIEKFVQNIKLPGPSSKSMFVPKSSRSSSNAASA